MAALTSNLVAGIALYSTPGLQAEFHCHGRAVQPVVLFSIFNYG